ncbi:MAG: polysaccharide pyruvyl transferase family protein [Muricomes sp.]
MKKVFIHAYTAGNLGDDLLIRLLCDRYPKVHFRICADESYKERFKDIDNILVYSPSDKSVRLADKLINKIKHTDRGFWKFLLKTSYATVHIGGSVFVQHQDDFSAAFHLDEELSARSKRIYVVGANFGPYTDEQYYLKYHELLKRYEGICFRDKYSWELFQELPNAMYAPDVVFNYKTNVSVPEKRQVLISLIDMKGEPENGESASIVCHTKSLLSVSQTGIYKRDIM